jgi:hypothetical protein
MAVTRRPYQLMARRKRFIVLRSEIKRDIMVTKTVKTGIPIAENSKKSVYK